MQSNSTLTNFHSIVDICRIGCQLLKFLVLYCTILIDIEFPESSYCAVNIDVVTGDLRSAAGFVEDPQVGADLVDTTPPLLRKNINVFFIPSPFSRQHLCGNVFQ